VRQAYYSDLQSGAGHVLESAAWGWHSETAIHVLRMVLAGTLDRHPRLRLIIGHMGEMLPVMLARIDQVSELDIEYPLAAPSSTRSGLRPGPELRGICRPRSGGRRPFAYQKRP
jgi:hypothetical protein